MKNQSAYEKKTFRDSNTEATVWKYEFTSPEDREKMLKKIQISSQFDMRYRGLFQFYSDELVAYKRKIGANKNGTEFLTVIAKHFTDNLENSNLTSWEDCQYSFWEELIFAYFPHLMKISKQQKQSVIFLSQLKKFVRWLDNQVKTSCFPVVEQFLEEANFELSKCERLLNYLFLLKYPTMHQKDWNMEVEIAKDESALNENDFTHYSVFQVTEIYDEIINVRDIDTTKDYQIIANMPSHMIKKDMLLDGVIGKKKFDFYWTWCITEGIYPERAKKYIKFID